MLLPKLYKYKTKPKNATALLKRARSLLTQHTRAWTQNGNYAATVDNIPTGHWCREDTGACCAYGALMRAQGPGPTFGTIEDICWRAEEHFRTALRNRQPRFDSPAIATWNDHPDTTLEDVLAVLDAAIEASL